MVQTDIQDIERPSVRPISITGMGILCAIGHDLVSMTQALQTGKSGICALENTDLPVSVAGWLKDFDAFSAFERLDDLPKALLERARTAVRRVSGAVQTAAAAALQAWQQAGLYAADLQSERVGLVIGGSNLSSRLSYDQHRRYQDDFTYISASYGLQCFDTDLVGVLSEIFQIQGPGFTVGGASASGNMALIQGQMLIQSGWVDRCLVVGAMADVSPAQVQAWQNMGAMGGHNFSAEQACRPFDAKRNGFIYGQGCGAVMLEHPDHARNRNAEIQATFKGSAVVLDGNRLSDPSAEGEARAMQQALDRSGLVAADIDYINTHGTSSVLGDATEVEAIKQVFQSSLDGLQINATKGLTGHCLYAAGMVEAIATILQMQQGFIHPNKNLETPIDNELPFAGASAEPVRLSAAVSNSFGFGGINTSVVLTNNSSESND